jgi:hypothetical protein
MYDCHGQSMLDGRTYHNTKSAMKPPSSAPIKALHAKKEPLPDRAAWDAATIDQATICTKIHVRESACFRGGTAD